MLKLHDFMKDFYIGSLTKEFNHCPLKLAALPFVYAPSNLKFSQPSTLFKLTWQVHQNAVIVLLILYSYRNEKFSIFVYLFLLVYKKKKIKKAIWQKWYQSRKKSEIKTRRHTKKTKINKTRSNFKYLDTRIFDQAWH